MTNKYLVYIDTSATATPSYKQLTPLNVDYDNGEEMDTWYTLASAYANNVKTALDPTWSMAFKFSSTDEAGNFIISKEFAVGTSAQCKVRLVNLIKGTVGKQIDFTATLSNISYSALTEEVLEVSFDLKIATGSTFVETDYSLSI